MTTLRTKIKQTAQPFADDDSRWQAIVDRNPAADGAFFFKTHTGLTPKGYAVAHRSRRVRDQLTRRQTVTDDPDDLARDLQDRFPEAQLEGGDANFEQLVAELLRREAR